MKNPTHSQDTTNDSLTAPASPVINATPLQKSYNAVYITDGAIRKLTFEALNFEEARQFAAKFGFGLVGEAPTTASTVVHFERPEAYDVIETRRILGGISRSKLYNLLKRNKLARLQDTRSVRVTRRSIDRYLARAA